VRFVLLVLLIVTTPAVAHAADGGSAPPPDPAKGERFDGRRSDPGAARRDAALAIPRLVLVIPRLAWRALFVPVGLAARWAERNHVMQRVLDAITSRDGVRPVVDFVSGTKAIFGLTYFTLRALGPATESRASLAGNIADAVAARLVLRPTSLVGAAQYILDIDFFSRNDQLFTGIGFEEARTLGRGGRYAITSFDLRNIVRLYAHEIVSLHAEGTFGVRKFGNGISVYGDPPILDVFCERAFEGRCLTGIVDEARVPGFNEGTQFVRAGLALRLDSRDSVSAPSSGAMLEVGGDYTRGLGDDRSSYFRFRGTLDLWKRSRVLVARVRAATVVPTGGEAVPFTEQFLLGDPDAVRGVRLGRYRDASLLVATLEYRWPVYLWMDAALFVDYGGMFGPRFRDFSFDKMIPAIGGALRVRSTRQLFLRVQIAYGFGEGTVLSFTANAF
jgi:hypothetical protein